MTTAAIPAERPPPAGRAAADGPPVPRDARAETWRDLRCALLGTDADDLPLFGRMPA